MILLFNALLIVLAVAMTAWLWRRISRSLGQLVDQLKEAVKRFAMEPPRQQAGPLLPEGVSVPLKDSVAPSSDTPVMAPPDYLHPAIRHRPLSGPSA